MQGDQVAGKVSDKGPLAAEGEPDLSRTLRNIARIANAVTITLYSKVTMQLFILLFSIVKNVISVSSVKSQVTKTFKKSENFQKI